MKIIYYLTYIFTWSSQTKSPISIKQEKVTEQRKLVITETGVKEWGMCRNLAKTYFSKDDCYSITAYCFQAEICFENILIFETNSEIKLLCKTIQFLVLVIRSIKKWYTHMDILTISSFQNTCTHTIHTYMYIYTHIYGPNMT